MRPPAEQLLHSRHDLPWIARLVAADLAKEHGFTP
jgi:hypothetical protein